LIVFHNRGWRIENYELKNRDHRYLGKNAVPQHAPCNRIAINLGEDIGENIHKRKVVDRNRQRYPSNVNQLACSRDTNNGEENVAKNNVVQELVVFHLLPRPIAQLICHVTILALLSGLLRAKIPDNLSKP
jgi:hypothetical protein